MYENRENYETCFYLEQTRLYLILAENGDSSLTFTSWGAAYPNKNKHSISKRQCDSENGGYACTSSKASLLHYQEMMISVDYKWSRADRPMKECRNQTFLAIPLFCYFSDAIKRGGGGRGGGIQMILVCYIIFIHQMKRENSGSQKNLPKFCL